MTKRIIGIGLIIILLVTLSLTATPVYAAVPPTVTTLPATDIMTDYANVSGTIDDTGGEDASLWGFEWGTSTGVYTDDFIMALGGYGIGTYGTSLYPILPSTVYFYRFFAENSAGRTNGVELSFKTLPLPSITSAPRSPKLTVKPLGWFQVYIQWPYLTGGVSHYMVRGKVNEYPVTTSDGYLVYQGMAREATDSRLRFNIRYTVFYLDGSGKWQAVYRGHR